MKNTIFLLFIGIMIASCNQKTNSKKEPTEKNTLTVDSLTNELSEIYKRGYINGFSVAIVNQNETLYQNGFGYADIEDKKEYTENTIQNIASISKISIAVALLKAKEMGLLKLDDAINKHLPFEVVNPYFPNEEITIRQLATHTSSILDSDFYWEKVYVLKDKLSDEQAKNKEFVDFFNNQDSYLPLSEFLEKILHKDSEWFKKETFANRKPGEFNEYSNIGAALCALVIESAAKTPFNEFTKKHIFTPLEMNSTGWFFDEVDLDKFSKLYIDKTELPHYIGLTYPDGHLITSSSDLAKLLEELIKGYSGNGTLLNKDSYSELFKSQLEKKHFEEGDDDNIGIFIEKLITRNVIGHSGSDLGVFTLMFFDPEKKIGRILIKNTESESDEANQAFWDVWNTLEKYQDRLE
ncbi:serine hydrolase domain-containing protein [Bernardetia sp. OM2101]|uniref:serine hydrolase domain-containing protein n=1 Tax=Bernardetia sp. OM2101 TaxID=3344876 RepID=UPI0035CEA086